VLVFFILGLVFLVFLTILVKPFKFLVVVLDFLDNLPGIFAKFLFAQILGPFLKHDFDVFSDIFNKNWNCLSIQIVLLAKLFC